MTQKERALRLIKKAIKVNEKTPCCVDITYFGDRSEIEFEIYPDKDREHDGAIFETFNLLHEDSEVDDAIEECLDETIKYGEMPTQEDRL